MLGTVRVPLCFDRHVKPQEADDDEEMRDAAKEVFALLGVCQVDSDMHVKLSGLLKRQSARRCERSQAFRLPIFCSTDYPYCL